MAGESPKAPAPAEKSPEKSEEEQLRELREMIPELEKLVQEQEVRARTLAGKLKNYSLEQIERLKKENAELESRLATLTAQLLTTVTAKLAPQDEVQLRAEYEALRKAAVTWGTAKKLPLGEIEKL